MVMSTSQVHRIKGVAFVVATCGNQLQPSRAAVGFERCRHVSLVLWAGPSGPTLTVCAVSSVQGQVDMSGSADPESLSCWAVVHAGVHAHATCSFLWAWVNTNGMPFWLVGEFTTHVRTYFSGWIGMFTGGTGFGF